MLCSISLSNVLFSTSMCVEANSVKFGLSFGPPFWKKLPALFAICPFRGCLIVFFCLFLWCWGLDVYQFLSSLIHFA